jgi:hypothetical protein
MKRAFRYFKIGYVLLLLLMFTAWIVRYSMEGGSAVSPKIEKFIVGFAQFPATVFKWFKPESHVDRRYIPDTQSKTGINYFTDTSKLASGYLLISTFQKNQDIAFELLDIRKNLFVKKWTVNPDTIISRSKTDQLDKKSMRLFHPLLLKDSSLIFQTGYSLIRINKASKIVWTSREMFHHSIEYASDSTIWACDRIIGKKPVIMVRRKDTLENDGIALVNSNTGKVISRKSILDILTQNGYKYLTAIGLFENDLFHLNEIRPALTTTKYWQKGDLLISLRHRSTVFLYRPATNKILWLKTGPWTNQHSCSFVDDEHIMVLGNDVMRADDYIKLLYGHNNVYLYDFKTNTIDTPYIKMAAQLKLQTFTEGRCNILPNGDVFFDETNNGKLYIFDRDHLKMSYCERIDSKHIKMMNLVRFIPKPAF